MLAPLLPALRCALNVTTLLVLTFSIGGCETAPRILLKPELLNRPVDSALKAPCPREPNHPDTFRNEEERFAWTMEALTTGRQCRSLSDKQGKFLANPSGAPEVSIHVGSRK